MPEPVDPFKIRAHVPNFEASVVDYQASSVSTRARLRARLDLAYGEGPAEKVDLFFPESATAAGPLPVHMFVHGGYWRANSKSDYSYVADSIVGQGAIAAIIEYSLMPGTRMGNLVDQVRRAAIWLGSRASDFGGDPNAISASGHSAGAHLVTYLACRAPHESELPSNRVRSILPISGIYDLAPIARSFLQPEIHLIAEEIAHWSPCDAIPRPGTFVQLVVGSLETAPFHEQVERFGRRLSAFGLSPRLSTIAGEDHMTIVRSLDRPQTECSDYLGETIAASRSRQ